MKILWSTLLVVAGSEEAEKIRHGRATVNILKDESQTLARQRLYWDAQSQEGEIHAYR